MALTRIHFFKLKILFIYRIFHLKKKNELDRIIFKKIE